MKAIVIDHYGGVDQLHLCELPDPRPQADEVLLRVRAAGVNPVDWKICQGQLRFILRLNFPYIPGGDMAGEVVAAGADVAQFKTGDPVVGFVDLKRGGGYAELAVAKKSAVALISPGELDWPNPTRPGDSLQVESEVLDIRPSRSRPDRGVAVVRSLTRNQRNEVVQRLTAKSIVLRLV